MKTRLAALALAALALAALTLTACQPQAPGLTEAALARDWALVAVDGVAMRGSIDLREPGRAAGQAPCNRWFGSRSGDLPAFALTGLGATRMACPDLAAEGAFLAALARVSAAELAGDRLVLTGAGTRIEFRPAP